MTKATDYCKGCLYRLGIVKTLINPCPQCKANGFSFAKLHSQSPTILSCEKRNSK